MGAWGAGIFENDDSLDYLYEMNESEQSEFLDESFSVGVNSDYLELEDCYSVIVGAAILDVSINDTKYDDVDLDEYSEWIEELGGLNLNNYVNPAINSLEKVIANSELKEVWEENNELYNDWESNIKGLIDRLNGVSS